MARKCSTFRRNSHSIWRFIWFAMAVNTNSSTFYSYYLRNELNQNQNNYRILRGNQLSGEIPIHLGDLSNIQVL